MTLMKYTEKLSRMILVAIYLTIAFFILKYFGNVVGYLLISFVVAIIAKPLVKFLRKIKLRGKSMPDVFLSLISIIFILAVLFALIAGFVPVFIKVASNIISLSDVASIRGLSASLNDLNNSLINIFRLASDFKIEVAAMDKFSSILDFKLFGNVIGTVAYTIGEIFVGLFAVVFISFFLIKDETIFPRIVSAVTPDKHLDHIKSSISEIERLLSRYFVGLIIEMCAVGVIDFIGLWSIAKLDVESALGIGFMAGILNVIPYLGPLIGGVVGTLMAMVLKYCSPAAAGGVSIWMFIIIAAAIFSIAQLVDNMLLQPIIYSTSVQAHPLEIFIVLLLAGSVGGIIGMLIAIPVYTVARVICINFFPDSKFVKSLLSGTGKGARH